MEKSFPVGKVDMINIYPMDFEEYLIANMGKEVIEIIQEHYNNNESLVDIMHNELISLYRLYLCAGGIPASVENILSNNKDILKYNTNILKNIIKGYLNDMKKYVKDSTETVRISNIYNSIPSQIGNKSNKFQLDELIPIEVKASDNVSSKSLKMYANQYNPKYAIKISTKNFGFTNGIKSVPLYATFCIK